MTFDELFDAAMTHFFGPSEVRDAAHALYATSVILVINGLCSFVAMFLKPPRGGTRFYPWKKAAYLIITWLAFNLRHAANSKQCNTTALQVGTDDLPAAKAALAARGVRILTRNKPDT